MNRKAYLDADHRFSIRNEEIPKPDILDVSVKIEANGICGSDMHFFSEGKLGSFIVEEPYVPGHECSGTIIEIGKEVKSFNIGDIVTIEPGIPCGKCDMCMSGRYNLCKQVIFLSAPPINGTFCDYISIASHMVHKIPQNITFQEAAMVEPTAVGVHAVNRARYRNGSTAAIVGAGPIGLLTLQVFKAAGGGKVICIDINRHRLEISKKLGADTTIDPSTSDDDLEGIADVVFETAGSDKATESLFKYAVIGGCVVQVGWPRNNFVKMDIARFIEKELDYIAVNRYTNAFATAIQWIKDGRINVKELITKEFCFDSIQKAFEFTVKNSDTNIKTIVVNKRR